MSILPQHIAIIMDGNERWAKKKSCSRFLAYKKSINNLPGLIRCTIKNNINILTLFAFCRDNWKRPINEIQIIMNLFYGELSDKLSMIMQKENIKFHLIGDRKRLKHEMLSNILKIEKKTRLNTGLVLNIAFDYSGKWEILEATKKILKQILYNPSLINNLNENEFENYLIKSIRYPVDLLIRTSGEKRISNFMIWQIAYAELYFTKKYWPDFNEKDLIKALNDYKLRDRRFGRRENNIEKS